MKTFSTRFLVLPVAVGILFAAPGTVRAQVARISPVAATPVAWKPGVWKSSAPDVRRPFVLSELNQHVGLGGAIGAVGGLVYGLAFERGKLRNLAIVGDSLMGFVIGMAGGAGVYLVKYAVSRR